MHIKECLLWLWKTSQGIRLSIGWSGGVGIVHAGISLFFVYVCKCLIDIATGHSQGNLKLWIGIMLGCMAGQLLLSAFRSQWNNRIEIRLCSRLRQQLFDHLMLSQWKGEKTRHTGDMLNRIEEDTLTVSDALCRTAPNIVITFFQLAGSLYFLAKLDVRLTGILICIMPLALLFSKTYVRNMRKISRDIRETDSRVQSFLQEHLQHSLLIRALEYTKQASCKLTSLQNHLRRQVIHRLNYSTYSRLMVQTGFATGYAVAFLWGIFGLYEETVTFGMMTAFLQLVSQVQRPMVELSRQIPASIRVFTSVERLNELYALPLEKQGSPIRIEGCAGIRIRELSFTYPGGRRKVLDHFSHDFTPGSLTVIVGETGVGKSTLVRLLLSLLSPQEGNITLYNHLGQEASASPLTRCNLSYVPQGNSLISGSIRENLLMGNPQASEASLRAALHAAAADFVFQMPEELDTPCGERGSGFSEGQAQRIAIARGLLRPGSILLLDEPSSALDAATEELLLNRLSALVHHKTLLLITHREHLAQLCTSSLSLKIEK